MISGPAGHLQSVRGIGDEEGLKTSVTEKCLGVVNPVMTCVREGRTPFYVRILGELV